MSATKTTSKKNNSYRRRFSDDQIKSLETTFETEPSPELRLKQHLANKLGLQPRQVAIWFQNKRARSKSKQIEGQYSILKTNYDNLVSQFEILRKENQALLIQLQRLRKMADKIDVVEHENKNHITLETPQAIVDIYSHEQHIPSCSDPIGKLDYLEDDIDFLNTAKIAEDSLGSPENGCSFESCTILDNTGSNSEWWDF